MNTTTPMQRVTTFPRAVMVNFFREEHAELRSTLYVPRLLSMFAALIVVLSGAGVLRGADWLRGVALMLGGCAVLVVLRLPRIRELCGMRCPRCDRLSGRAANFQGDLLKCKPCGETWIP